MNILVLLLVLGMTSAQMLVSPVSRDCRELGTIREDYEDGGPVAEYGVGEVMLVKAHIPKAKGGVFEFYLCPEFGPKEEECLIKLPLKLAVRQEEVTDISKMSEDGLYEIPLMLPEDVECDSCTLLWEVVSADCPSEEGGDCSTWRTTTCADISIVNHRERQTRGWDYLKGFFSRALEGAARGFFGRIRNAS